MKRCCHKPDTTHLLLTPCSLHTPPGSRGAGVHTTHTPHTHTHPHLPTHTSRPDYVPQPTLCVRCAPLPSHSPSSRSITHTAHCDMLRDAIGEPLKLNPSEGLRENICDVDRRSNVHEFHSSFSLAMTGVVESDIHVSRMLRPSRVIITNQYCCTIITKYTRRRARLPTKFSHQLLHIC